MCFLQGDTPARPNVVPRSTGPSRHLSPAAARFRDPCARYRASKPALSTLARSFEIRHGAGAVFVLVPHPGWVCTEMGGEGANIDSCCRADERPLWRNIDCGLCGWVGLIKECLLFQTIVSKAAAPFMVKFDRALRIILGRQARQFLRRLLRRPVMGSQSKNADRRAECDQSTN